MAGGLPIATQGDKRKNTNVLSGELCPCWCTITSSSVYRALTLLDGLILGLFGWGMYAAHAAKIGVCLVEDEKHPELFVGGIQIFEETERTERIPWKFKTVEVGFGMKTNRQT